jgi:hypothetical protein
MNKEDLRTHINTHLRDVLEPAPAVLSEMVAVLKALSDATVLAALVPPAGRVRGRSNRSPPPVGDEAQSNAARSDRSASEEPERSRPGGGETSVNRRESNYQSSATGSSTNSSSRKRQRTGDSGDDEEEDSQSDDSVDSRASDEQSVVTKSSSRTSRRQRRRRVEVQMLESCPSGDCRQVAPVDSIPDFCSSCGKAWRKATTTTTAIPQKWKHLDRFVYTPLAALASAPFRPTHLAALSESTIKKAREGQQHFILAEFLPPTADDGTHATPSDAVVVLDQTGAITSATGARAQELRTLAARKRHITGISEIAEVFLFSLIPLVYEGRPDIGEQLYRLLTIAIDIYRCHGNDWRLALRYVNHIRSLYWEDLGVKHRHILSIDTTMDLGLYDSAAFVSVVVPRHGTPQQNTSHASSSSGSAVAGHPKDDTCRDWNKGSCTRENCRFGHRCNNCKGDHPRTQCPKVGGGARQTSSTPRSSTPHPASSQPGTPGS